MEQRIALRGGDVASAYKVITESGYVYFEKTLATARPGFFAMERYGLDWLAMTGAVRVPQVLDHSDQPTPFLRLAWIDAGGHPTPQTDAEFGQQLAKLHRFGIDHFGRPDGALTGSLGLPNDPCDTWAEFYAQQRLVPLARIGVDRGAWGSESAAEIERVAARLTEIAGDTAASEPPSLLHGDLWAGNRLVDSDGNSWLIDPAAHGGHREFDLAMMRLFGGFSHHIFDAYDEAFPLAPGWHDRVHLHQLAPLLVHAIKFGGGYHRAAAEALTRYL